MTPEVQKLKDAYEANKVEVQTALTGLGTKIAELQTQLAAVPGVSADLTALADEIAADTAALHATQNPVTP